MTGVHEADPINNTARKQNGTLGLGGGGGRPGSEFELLGIYFLLPTPRSPRGRRNDDYNGYPYKKVILTHKQ